MSFWSKSKSDKLVLILDISSGSVGSALVSLNKFGSLPKVLKCSRVPLFLTDEPTSKSIENAVLKSIKIAVENVGLKSIDKALISFSSPWIESKLKYVVKNFDKPYLVNQKIVAGLLNDEEVAFLNELKAKYKEENEIFNSKITNIYLNGYKSDLGTPNKASKLEVQFMLCACQKKFLDKIHNQIINLVGIRDGLILENFMFSFFKVFTSYFSNLHSALLVNMSNETLDLLLIQNTYPLVSISLPFGPAHMAREIQKTLNIPLEVAYSYIDLYSENSLNVEIKAQIVSIFNNAKKDWDRAWLSVTKELPKDLIMPKKIYLIGSSSHESIIKDLLSFNFSNHKVEQISDEDIFIKKIVNYEDGCIVDERISVLSAYVNQII